MTSKGRVTIPSEIRAALELKQGDRIHFVEIEKETFVIVTANLPVQRLKGLVKRPRNPESVERMNAAIAIRGAGNR